MPSHVRLSPARVSATVLSVVLGAAALSACSSGSTSAGSSTSSSSAASSSAAAVSSSASSAAASAAASSASSAAASSPALGQVVEIVVAGGTVTGPKGRVAVELGSTVTLKVTSDVADEVHLHGYDKHVDVAKGGTALLTFKASIPGVFEAELESRALRIVQLQVQ